MQSGDFITETWFMTLLISMVSVMVLLFGAMFFVRRRQMLSKKSMTPSRSNGGVLTTPLDKHEAPLWLDKDNLPEYSATLPEYSKLTPQSDYKRKTYLVNGSTPQSNGIHYHGSVNLHSNPLHQSEFNRPDNLQYSSEKCYPVNGRKYDDFSNMQVQEYASPNIETNKISQVADYAEVNANGNATIIDGGSTSPAPYATTTLVAGSKRMVCCPENHFAFVSLNAFIYFSYGMVSLPALMMNVLIHQPMVDITTERCTQIPTSHQCKPLEKIEKKGNLKKHLLT